MIPTYTFDEMGQPVYWGEVIQEDEDHRADELTQAKQRITKLEAENKELLAIADNTALILAGHRIAELEESVAELSETITRLVTTGRAVINHPCEVNWTALQYNIAEAQNMVHCTVEPEEVHL